MSTLSKSSLELFLSACGATGPVPLAVEGPEAGAIRSAVLEQPFAVIGREPHADLCLDQWYVSRRHAYLQLIDGKWFCIDLLSQKGIHWSDGPRRAGWVDDVHGIQIGSFHIRSAHSPRDASAPSWDPLNDRAPVTAALPSAILEFLNGEVQQSSWRMSRVLALVGQAPECKVRLVAPSVSKFHCALVRTRVGTWAVDLLGRGGIKVNGEATRCALLRDGDLLEVGEFVIRLRYEPAPLRPPAQDRSPEEPANRRPADSEAMPRNGADFRNEPVPGGSANPLVVAESPSVLFLPAERPASEAEVVERLLVPLVNEFRLMQQQMFDQFQQAMSSMCNMFTSMHREQTDLIREELDRLHELTKELHTLQAELAKHGPREARAATPRGTAVPHSEQPRPAPRTVSSPSQGPVGGTAAGEVQAAAVPPQAEGETGDEIHLWLTQRMAVINRERQSSWQRILNFLMGKNP